MDFELVKGRKGQGSTIQTSEGDFDPSDFNTISRGVGKCLNCENVIENDLIYSQGRSGQMQHSLYAIAYREGESDLKFRLPHEVDLEAIQKVQDCLQSKIYYFQENIPTVEIPYGHQFAERSSLIQQGIDRWDKVFNPRQLLTLVTYVEILNEAKERLGLKYEPERVSAIATYLAFVLDRCIDHNSRLSGWRSSRAAVDRASKTHALNLTWNYPCPLIYESHRLAQQRPLHAGLGSGAEGQSPASATSANASPKKKPWLTCGLWMKSGQSRLRAD